MSTREEIISGFYTHKEKALQLFADKFHCSQAVPVRGH